MEIMNHSEWFWLAVKAIFKIKPKSSKFTGSISIPIGWQVDKYCTPTLKSVEVATFFILFQSVLIGSYQVTWPFMNNFNSWCRTSSRDAIWCHMMSLEVMRKSREVIDFLKPKCSRWSIHQTEFKSEYFQKLIFKIDS